MTASRACTCAVERSTTRRPTVSLTITILPRPLPRLMRNAELTADICALTKQPFEPVDDPVVVRSRGTVPSAQVLGGELDMNPAPLRRREMQFNRRCRGVGLGGIDEDAGHAEHLV